MVLVGETVSVLCESLSQTIWMKNKVKVKHLQTGSDLVIHNANNRHSGIYTCQGTTMSGKMFSSTAEVIVASKNSNCFFNIIPDIESVEVST